MKRIDKIPLVECDFFKSMNHWKAKLKCCDDPAERDYLKEKYESAKAVVARRDAMGIYSDYPWDLLLEDLKAFGESFRTK